MPRKTAFALSWFILAGFGAAPLAAQGNFAASGSFDPVVQRMQEAEAAGRAATRARDRARASAARARAAEQRARSEARISSAARQAAEREAQRAREEARGDAVAAAREKARAERLDDAAKAAQQVQRDAEWWKWFAIIAGVAAVLILLLVFLILRRRARRRALAELAEFRRRRPDPVADAILLSPRLNLQLPGDKLPEGAGGVVVGRNPKVATAVINHEDVSRRHARFFHRGGQYWLEDLGSTEGSWVDDDRLDEGVPVLVEPGAQVRFAAYTFRFDIED